MYNNIMFNHNTNINTIIPGILIEGDDYTGKTTVAKEIVRRLSEKKQKVSYGHYYLSDNPIIKFLSKKAKASKNCAEKNKLRVAAALIDLFAFRVRKNTFYVQDRNWISINKKYNLKRKNKLLLNHYTFSINIYLQASLEIQKKRYIELHGQDNVSKLSNFKENLHHQTVLPPGENWYVLQTDCKSIEEITDEIYRLIFVSNKGNPLIFSKNKN